MDHVSEVQSGSLETLDSDDSRKKSPLRVIARLLAALAWLGSIGGLALTLSALGARWHPWLELTTHFPLQIAFGCGCLCLSFICLRRWRSALLPAAVAIVNAAYLVPLLLPQSEQPAAAPKLRAISANVLTSNRNKRSLIDLVRRERPDLVLAMETDELWHLALQKLNSEYPYSVNMPRPDNFGIILMSRTPILSHRIEYLDESEVPTIVASINSSGKTIHIVGTHPLPPVGARGASLRNDHLKALGELVSRLPKPVIVLGDLNITSWSPYFRDLLHSADLRDSRRGFGVQPTWPDKPWLLRIPIDHALVSNDVVVTERRVGPDIGSDHRPILVQFAVRP